MLRSHSDAPGLSIPVLFITLSNILVLLIDVFILYFTYKSKQSNVNTCNANYFP